MPVALVTGGNRGLGFEIARRLGLSGHRVVVAARDRERGERARAELTGHGASAESLELDVTDDAAVSGLGDRVRHGFGRLDVLVNNAGISLDHWQPPSAVEVSMLRETFATNVFGAFAVTGTLMPLLRESPRPRIVFMSSSLGSLAEIGNPDSYYYGVVSPAYQASKTALNALTVLFARELLETPAKVNAACPGWVRTALGGERAPRSVEEGADTPVWLATLPEDGPTGGFFRDRRRIDW